MTFIVLESFDNYNTDPGVSTGNGILNGGWSCGYPFDSSIITGRYGGQALRKPVAGGREDWFRQFSPGVTTFAMGFDCRISGLGIPVVCATEFGSADHLWINALGSGAIEVRRGNGGTVLGTTVGGVVAANTWFFLEIAAVIADSGGQLFVAVDGIELINVTGIDTRNGGSSGVFNAFDIIESGGTKDIDNLYIKDTLGFLGPSKFLPFTAIADDASSGFTPLSGTTLYEMVDEAKADGDTSYISASAVNDQATFVMSDISSSGIGTVYAVNVSINMKRADTTSGRAVKALIKDDSTSYVQPAGNLILNDAYRFAYTIFELDPSGNPLSVAAVNNMRLGVRVTV